MNTNWIAFGDCLWKRGFGLHYPLANVFPGSGRRGSRPTMREPEDILDAAEAVAGILKGHQVEPVVIGAVALAAHNYVRQTEDIDLGVNADLATLRSLVRALAKEGFDAKLREPDDQDPLGGVIDVEGPFGLLQIVSFAGRFPAAIDDALRDAELVVREGSLLPLAPIPQLVALKLYAGGFRSKADIIELLARNPEVNREDVLETCRRYRLGGLEELLDEIP